MDPPGGGFSSFFYIEDAGDLTGATAHTIDSIGGLAMGGSTVDEVCRRLEDGLDRPLVNETKLEGRFDFQLQDPELGPQELPKRDFVELRDELGLVITTAQRNVETLVYRLR